MPSLRLPALPALAAALVLWWGAAPARAQAAADAYTVAEIEVDVTASAVQAAKDQALLEAQRRGFSILLDRIVSAADRSRLPEADGVQYVRDFTVDRERRTATRYIATLTVRYNPASVKRLLEGAGVGFVEPRSRAVVMVPVYTGADGKAVLWDDPNPWREAWAAQRGALVPIEAPTGDLTDVQTITAAQALAGDALAMQSLGARRRTPDVVVAAAGMANGRLDVTLHAGPTAPLPFPTISYAAQAGESEAALLARAAKDISRAMDEVYKQANVLNLEKSGSVAALAPLTGLPQWLALRDRLNRVPQVRSWELVQLSRNEAALILHVAGDVEQVRGALSRGGLDLAWTDGFWTLRPVGVN